MPPIDPFQQHGKLRVRQRHCSARRLRPNESPALQSFREQTQPVPIEPQHFHQVAAPPTKQEHMAGKRILVQHRLHHPAQSRESASQVGHSGGDPNPCSCRQPDHHARHSSTARSAITSTDPAMRTVPFASFTSIVPERRARQSPCAASAPRLSVTFTLRSCVAVRPPSRPSRYSFRQ